MVLWKRLEYNTTLDWVDKLSCILCTLYCIFLFIMTIRLFIKTELIDLQNVYIKKIAVFSIIVLLSYVICCFTVVINHWNIHNQHIPCSILIKLEACIYALTKFLLYIFLTFRVDIAFDNSTLRYKKYVLQLFRIISFILLTLIWLILCIYIDGIKIISKIAYNVPFCQSIVGIEAAFIGLTIDTGVACTCLSLFGRKIYQASTVHHGIKTVGFCRDKILINTFRKNAVLAFVAILSTFILIFISTFGLTGVTIPLDCCINASCVFLMFAKSQLIYSKLCGKCEHCITDSLLAKCACVFSEEHLNKISRISIHNVTTRNHSQISHQYARSAACAFSDKDLSQIQKQIHLHHNYSKSVEMNTFNTNTNTTNTLTKNTPNSILISPLNSYLAASNIKQVTPTQNSEDDDDDDTNFVNDMIQYNDVNDILQEANENDSSSNSNTDQTDNKHNANSIIETLKGKHENININIEAEPLQLLKSDSTESKRKSESENNNNNNNNNNKKLHIEIDKMEEENNKLNEENEESIDCINDNNDIEPPLNKKQSSFNPLNLTPLYEPTNYSNRSRSASPSLGSNIENREYRGNTISILANEMMMMPDLDINEHIINNNRKYTLSQSIQPGTETCL